MHLPQWKDAISTPTIIARSGIWPWSTIALLMIPDNNGPTGNAKRFALTRNKEDQADAGILQHVVERIDAAVTATIRNGKGRIVKTPYESRAISLWQ
jgi:hypothetical protein